jgi:hypothetical protein
MTTDKRNTTMNTKSKTTAPKTITLAQVARSLGWEPKTVRQYARRHPNALPKTTGKRYTYPASALAQVKKVITDGVAAE